MWQRHTFVSSPNFTASKIYLPKRYGSELKSCFSKISLTVIFKVFSFAMINLIFFLKRQDKCLNFSSFSTFEIRFFGDDSIFSLIFSEGFLSITRLFQYYFLICWNSSFLIFSKILIFSGSVCKQKQRLLLQYVTQSFSTFANYDATNGLTTRSSQRTSFSPCYYCFYLFQLFERYFFCISLKLNLRDYFMFYFYQDYNHQKAATAGQSKKWQNNTYLMIHFRGLLLASQSEQIGFIIIYSFDYFTMRIRDEIMTMGRIHSSVQEMLAEARQIVSPSFSLPKSHGSHMDVYLPATEINQHLKEILRGPSDHYKKIERTKRYESVSLQYYSEKQEKQHSNLMMHMKNPKQMSTSLNRYAMDSIMTNNQNQLLDRRNKRPLYNKKTVNLLPQLPNIPIKNQSKELRGKELYYEQNIQDWMHKYYYTITEKPTDMAPDEKCNEDKISNPIEIDENLKKNKKMLRQQLQKSKRVKSQLLRNLEDKPAQVIEPKVGINIERKISKAKAEQQYDPSPWAHDYKKEQYFDFNNF